MWSRFASWKKSWVTHQLDCQERDAWVKEIRFSVSHASLLGDPGSLGRDEWLDGRKTGLLYPGAFLFSWQSNCLTGVSLMKSCKVRTWNLKSVRFVPGLWERVFTFQRGFLVSPLEISFREGTAPTLNFASELCTISESTDHTSTCFRPIPVFQLA